MSRWNPVEQVQDLVNKLGGGERIERILSGELVVVEKTKPISLDGQANGGITYVSGLDTAKFLADWTEFYKIHYGFPGSLCAVPLPPITSDFNWGVVVLSTLTVQQVFAKSGKLFRTWKYTTGSLDDAIDQAKDERNADSGPYVIWCRDRVEADEGLKNVSANQICKRGLTTMTLLERELLEQWFFWKTQDHLDKKSVTLCAGSHGFNGGVPRVSWDVGNPEFCVDWCYADRFHNELRARQVVSLPAGLTFEPLNP